MMPKRISSFISRLTVISLFVFCATAAHAQSTMSKGIVSEKDTIAFFRGVAVSVDAVGAAQLAFSDYGQYEGALRINLRDKYFPVIELGWGKADASDISTKLTYKTSAPYGKIGIDFNLMRNKHDFYRVYAGLRYAYTSYKFDVSSEGLKDPVWGDDLAYSAKDVKCNYHWTEIVFGVDAKICGPLRLGWSVRYRRRLIHNDGTLGNTWYVPGYGKQGSSRLGGTFNIIFEI